VTDSCFENIGGFNEPIADVLPKKKVLGNKESKASYVEARQQRLYTRQLDGLPVRQLVLDHAKREGVCKATAWKDWHQVKLWTQEDWEKDRENMLSRLQAARLRLFEKAVRKGQLQTAAQVLDSIGKVIGESIEHVSIQAPELSIKVESKLD
tara:strand:- start:1109 stop:1564 length:456 start_codon:yes stop_codon:yes gene_type:complete